MNSVFFADWVRFGAPKEVPRGFRRCLSYLRFAFTSCRPTQCPFSALRAAARRAHSSAQCLRVCRALSALLLRACAMQLSSPQQRTALSSAIRYENEPLMERLATAMK